MMKRMENKFKKERMIIHNPDFNYGEFATIKSQAGLNQIAIHQMKILLDDKSDRMLEGEI